MPTLRAVALATALAYARVGYAATTLQATVTASAGVTDNVDSSPTDTPPGSPGRQTDLIVTLTPGLILTTGSSRAIQRLSYLFNAIIYAKESGSDTYTNNLLWSAFFIPSKRSTMTLNFSLGEGRQSTFNNLADSSTPNVQVQPPAILETLNINAGQGFAYELTRRLRLLQSLAFGTTYLLGQGQQDETVPTTQDVNGRIGFDYTYARDVIGIDANFDYANYPAQNGPVIVPGGAVNPTGVITPREQQLTLTPLSRWRRDLTYFLSLRANLGAVVVFDPTDVHHLLAQPAGGAGLNIFSKRVSFDLAYAHGAQTNLIFRSNFLTDSATLRGVFWLSERHAITLNLGLGYAYSREIAIDATLGSTAHTITGDATVTFAPYRFMSFFLRYQITDQIGRPTDPLPIADYYRNTLLFGLTAIYPPAVAGDVPNQPYGLRADGRDAPQISSSKSTPK
jgi:hypothetical protein